MQAVKSAYILAVRAGLAAEALGVSAVLYWQLLLIQDNIAVDVGYGNLGCRNQIEVINLTVVHLALLVGQLSCAVTRCGVNYGRRHDLSVTGLVSLGQEEIDECALQLCTFSYIYGESCACYLYTQVKVNQVVLLGQFPMRNLGVGVLGVTGPVAYGILSDNTLLEI